MAESGLALTRPLSCALQVDRGHYAPSSPYHDSPQPLGYAATISAPHMHASAVESLLPFLLPSTSSSAARPRRVLDIGSGSGYLTHVIAELVCGGGGGADGETNGAGGTVVVGVDHIPQLRDMAEGNMSKSEEGKGLLASGRVRFRVGDGRKGWVEPDEKGEGEGEGGWDAIHVGASAAELHPELVAQLRAPGRMFIPVDDEAGGRERGWEGGQHVWAVDKDEDGVVTKKRLFAVRYVPLTDGPGN